MAADTWRAVLLSGCLTALVGCPAIAEGSGCPGSGCTAGCGEVDRRPWWPWIHRVVRSRAPGLERPRGSQHSVSLVHVGMRASRKAGASVPKAGPPCRVRLGEGKRRNSPSVLQGYPWWRGRGF